MVRQDDSRHDLPSSTEQYLCQQRSGRSQAPRSFAGSTLFHDSKARVTRDLRWSTGCHYHIIDIWSARALHNSVLVPEARAAIQPPPSWRTLASVHSSTRRCDGLPWWAATARHARHAPSIVASSLCALAGGLPLFDAGGHGPSLQPAPATWDGRRRWGAPVAARFWAVLRGRNALPVRGQP